MEQIKNEVTKMTNKVCVSGTIVVKKLFGNFLKIVLNVKTLGKDKVINNYITCYFVNDAENMNQKLQMYDKLSVECHVEKVWHAKSEDYLQRLVVDSFRISNFGEDTGIDSNTFVIEGVVNNKYSPNENFVILNVQNGSNVLNISVLGVLTKRVNELAMQSHIRIKGTIQNHTGKNNKIFESLVAHYIEPLE